MTEEILKLADAGGAKSAKTKDAGPDLIEYGYQHVAVIGRGQYGIAQLVCRPGETNDCLVAKSVQVDSLNEHDQKLAHQEVQLLQQMRHPHIVGYIESFSLAPSNILIIVMEYAPHGDLRKLIKGAAKKREHMPEDVIMRWFTQLLHALNYIHKQKILHRDLKTSNIFLSGETDASRIEEYSVKLGDFGISRVLDGTREAAVTVVGTPYYMSPEVCRSEPYNWKSDVWALGCVLYELCMLKHAFESSSLLGLVYKIVSENYDPIPSMYSARLMEIIKRLLTKSAEARPETTEMLLDGYVRETADALQLPDNDSMISLSPGKKDRATAPPPPGPPPLASGVARPPPGPPPAGIKKPPSAPPLPGSPAPPGAANGNGVAATPSKPSLQVPAENQELFEVLMARIRAVLVTRKSNWISVFAGFDKKGDGLFPPALFVEALRALNCGLSNPEINFLVACFSSAAAPADNTGGSGIPLFHFAEHLNCAPGVCAKRVDTAVRELFDGAKLQILFQKCVQTDPENRGVVSADNFKIAIAQCLDTLNSERNVMLALMSSEKNLAGEVDYREFVHVFGAICEVFPFTATPAKPPPVAPPSGVAASPPHGSPQDSTQFFTCRVPLAPSSVQVPMGHSRSSVPPTPFRAMSAEGQKIIWARLKKKFTTCTLTDVWQLYFQDAPQVNAWSFIDLCSDIPFGVSRAELHQCCAAISADGQVGIDAIEDQLLMSDENFLTMPSWGKVMQDLVQGNLWGNKGIVPEAEFRSKLSEMDNGLTSHQLDYLISTVDKTSEGDLLLHRHAPRPVAPVDLAAGHYELVCRRLTVKLRACAGLDVPRLTKILANFWSVPEWSNCLSMLLPLYLSEAEANGLVLRLLEGQQTVDEWAAAVQQTGCGVTLSVDPKVGEFLAGSLNEPVPEEQFCSLLAPLGPDYGRQLCFAADKTHNGFVMASSWLADEGIVSKQQAKALKKKRSFLTRIFK
ncbi:unnamed protein product [Amoebophrya sp. A25]|nr:unnamed protein product [Amoebophrya sp. A25]|eukprot:GSA25T00005424001.1